MHNVSWTGDTDFTSNVASGDGGAVGSPAFDVEYNFLSSTLVMKGSTAFVNNTSAGLYMDHDVTQMTVRNNIFYQAGSGYAVYDYDSGLSATTLDYNLYYTSGGGRIGYLSGATHSSLLAWPNARAALRDEWHLRAYSGFRRPQDDEGCRRHC